MARSTKKSAPTTGKSGYALGVKLTEQELDQLAKSTFIPHLDGGGTMQALREQYGPSRRIRAALVRAGYQPIGARRGIKPVTVKGVKPAQLAKTVAARRAEGAGWDLIVFETGVKADELKALLRKYKQHAPLAQGRVVLRQKSKVAA